MASNPPEPNKSTKASIFRSPLALVGIAVVIAIMLFYTQTNKLDKAARQASSQAPATKTGTRNGPSAAELIPVTTGGAGGDTSLGGTPSLGGGAHHH
jgi:hypothetical protein